MPSLPAIPPVLLKNPFSHDALSDHYADSPPYRQVKSRPAAMKTSTLTRCWRLARLFVHLLFGLIEAGLLFPRRTPEARPAAIQRWSACLCAILAVEIRVSGMPPASLSPANTILVANHISWLDIFVMNAVTTSRFVAKAEVRSWPLIGWLCARTGTLFVTRERRHDTRRVNNEIAAALAGGDCIAVFPEGSTTDGFDVVGFNASLLQPAVDAAATVQPMVLRYYDSQGKRTDAAAYVGEMSLVDSMRRLFAEPRLVAEITYLPPFAAAEHTRREIAAAAQAAIREVVVSDLPA